MLEGMGLVLAVGAIFTKIYSVCALPPPYNGGNWYTMQPYGHSIEPSTCLGNYSQLITFLFTIVASHNVPISWNQLSVP